MESANNNATRSSSSPKFIRPIEVFSLRRKVKRVSTVLQPLDGNVLANSENIPGSNFKISNPFKVFGKFPRKRKVEDAHVENAISFDGSAQVNKNSEASESEKAERTADRGKHLPLDWSLKTRLRFMSRKPFPFRGSLKTCEESSGTTGFVRCLHSDRAQECSLDTSANAKFHQQCLVWQQPYLPWLKLFPRLQDSGQGQSSGFANDSMIQEALINEWCESLRSLFLLVRTLQCSFFYLCGQSFTVLFRAAGIGGLPDTHALLTPTTSGLRKILKSQGIEFTMPLFAKTDLQESPSSLVNKPDKENGVCEDETVGDGREDEEKPEEFLESLGLSQQDFPSFNPKKRKIDQESRENDWDTKRDSLIVVEGPEVQALVQFLLSRQGRALGMSSTGPLAGVPPTLLAPSAFNGATLTPIKARQGWVKQGEKTLHCVDLSGPILPNMVHGLATLFAGTQDGDFSAVLASDLATTSFTSVGPDGDASASSAFATENLKDCGLSADFLLWLCSSVHRTVLHQLSAKEGTFSWT